ncbi:MAG: hypothetical protein V4677_14795 [Bacteroidota bacterium]
MNTSISYIPNSDSDRTVWLNNFSTKINTYATLVGLTPAEVTAVQKDFSMYAYVINMLEVYKQTVNNITSYKNLLKHAVGQQHLGALPVAPTLPTAPVVVTEGVFDRISKLVKRIKASASYTEAMGNDLGIIAPVQVFDVNAMQPELKVNLDGDRPHIKCAKGYSDGIDLYVDRKDGAGFVLIGRLTKPDYIDIVDLPQNVLLAEWDYKARYVIDNNVVGMMSSIASIVVKKS